GDVQVEPVVVAELGVVARDDSVDDVRTGVAHVYVVLNCRSANKHPYLATAQTYDRLLLPGERVKNYESAPQEKRDARWSAGINLLNPGWIGLDASIVLRKENSVLRQTHVGATTP